MAFLYTEIGFYALGYNMYQYSKKSFYKSFMMMIMIMCGFGIEKNRTYFFNTIIYSKINFSVTNLPRFIKELENYL